MVVYYTYGTNLDLQSAREKSRDHNHRCSVISATLRSRSYIYIRPECGIRILDDLSHRLLLIPSSLDRYSTDIHIKIN